MKVRINTNRFQASHMKSPKGRGMWAFEDKDRNIVIMKSGSFAEVKKMAIAKAKEIGLFEIFVSP